MTHADLYRISDARELEELGLDEAMADGALVVEWPERLPPDISAERLDIALEIAGAGRRADVIGDGNLAGAARTHGCDPCVSRQRRLARCEAHAACGRCILPGVRKRSCDGRAPSPPCGGETERGKDAAAAFICPPPYPPPQGGRESAILMNAPARIEGPPIYAGRSYDAVAHRAMDVRAFVAIDIALREAGIRTPEILAADLEQGLLLLENLGNEVIVDPSGAPIIERYEASIDLLAFMHGRAWPHEAPLPDGTHIPTPALRSRCAARSKYRSSRTGSAVTAASPPSRRNGATNFWPSGRSCSTRSTTRDTTWTLRDFHSPNILWQENASGLARVGVIDFQDALIGHPAYDVASLAQDARVPLTEDQEAGLRARYIAARRAADPRFRRTGLPPRLFHPRPAARHQGSGHFHPAGAGRGKTRLSAAPGAA